MATLFATTVASAKPAAKDYKLSDGAGLYLLVRPNGSKLWRFNYVHHGKYRMLAFNAWPEVCLAGARGKRCKARRLVAAGLDPSHEEKVVSAMARVEESDTLKTVAKEWIARNERENMAEITLSKIRWPLDMASPIRNFCFCIKSRVTASRYSCPMSRLWLPPKSRSSVTCSPSPRQIAGRDGSVHPFAKIHIRRSQNRFRTASRIVRPSGSISSRLNPAGARPS